MYATRSYYDPPDTAELCDNLSMLRCIKAPAVVVVTPAQFLREFGRL